MVLIPLTPFLQYVLRRHGGEVGSRKGWRPWVPSQVIVFQEQERPWWVWPQ
jgi:hypothetical protein